MKKRVSLLLIVSAVLLVNLIGFILQYFDMNSFIVILGFRFHLALTLPFFFVVRGLNGAEFRKEFSDPEFKKNYPYVFPLIIIPVTLFTLAFLLNIIELGDPEYLYEFGLSSVLDLPIYLVWNSPQLILFYFFLQYASRYKSFVISFVSAVFPFLFEFIQLKPLMFDIIGLICLVLIAFISAILLKRLKNIYWFIIFMFILLWQFILLYGSSSAVLIKIIFATQYSAWEGLFTQENIFREYSLPVYIGIVTLLLFIFTLSGKKEKVVT